MKGTFLEMTFGACLTKPPLKTLYNNTHTHTQLCKQCSLKTRLLKDTIIHYNSRVCLVLSFYQFVYLFVFM